jgi:hypothetical protein
VVTAGKTPSQEMRGLIVWAPIGIFRRIVEPAGLWGGNDG